MLEHIREGRKGRLARAMFAAALLAVALPIQGAGVAAQTARPREEAAAGSVEARYEELPNFHRVNDRLYRGGQPREGGIRRLAALGVNTVVNLRDDDARARREATEALAAGLRYFNIPLKRLGRPTDEQVGRVLAVVNAPESGRVFVHCARGADRTGVVVAAYRIAHDGWTGGEAKREAERYGMRFWQRGMKDYIGDYYRRRKGASARAGRREPVESVTH